MLSKELRLSRRPFKIKPVLSEDFHKSFAALGKAFEVFSCREKQQASLEINLYPERKDFYEFVKQRVKLSQMCCTG